MIMVILHIIITTTTTRERSPRRAVGEMHVLQADMFNQALKVMSFTMYFEHLVSYMSQTPRKLPEFGGAEDTGNRTWDLLHHRADPHQLSYTCSFPLVLFLFPLLSPSCPTWQALWARLPDYRRKSLTTEGNPLL